MVGHLPLEEGIGVRVPDRQPTRAALETHSFNKNNLNLYESRRNDGDGIKTRF